MSNSEPIQRGRVGRPENLSQGASHHHPQGSLVAREEDARKGKAQASRPSFARPPQTKTAAAAAAAAALVSYDTFAANKLFPPAVFTDDGLLALPPNSHYLDPTPELTSGNLSRQAPEHCSGCTETPANQGDGDLPHPPPPPIQPTAQKEHVPKPAIEYDAHTNQRIAALDKDTQTLVKSYGGYPLDNQLRVLDKVEAWQAEHRQSLMDVERKDGKGGVLSVICNVCLAQKPDTPLEEAQHKTVQKAAEHIISFHWELSAWACILDGCEKIFRRKQECDRHEESHGIVTKKKGKKIANQATTNTVRPPNPVSTTVADKITCGANKVKNKRHNPVPSTSAFLVPPSADGGPVRSRSREPSPYRPVPYSIRLNHSAPDLLAPQTRPPYSPSHLPQTRVLTTVADNFNAAPGTFATTVHRSKNNRHDPMPPTGALLSPPSADGRPVQSISRESSPSRQDWHQPHLSPTHSTSNLPTTVATQPSTSKVSYGQDRTPPYLAPSPPTIMNPAPQLRVTNSTGYSQPLYPPPTVTPSQSVGFQTYQGYTGQAILPQSYSPDSFVPLQVQHVAQMQIPSGSTGTRPIQIQTTPAPYRQPHRVDPSSMQTGPIHQQYGYTQPPMNVTGTSRGTIHYQPGSNPYHSNDLPYVPDHWNYQGNF